MAEPPLTARELRQLRQILAPAPRAAPPITIGPFANVPAPGSPIASAWAQQTAQYQANAVPVYATVAAAKADTFSKNCIVILGSAPGIPMWCTRDSTGAWVGEYTNVPAARTTDASGMVSWSAADLNFTTLLAGVVSTNWSATLGASTPQLATCRVASNALQCKVWAISAATGGTLSQLASISVLIYMHVRGVL